MHTTHLKSDYINKTISFNVIHNETKLCSLTSEVSLNYIRVKLGIPEIP